MEHAGMTRIFLGGMLGKLFGKVWYLAVRSPAEAIRAIDMNTNRKFGSYLMKEGRNKYYKVSVFDKVNTIKREDLKSFTGNFDIYITPVIRGAGNIVRIIIGIVLIIVGAVVDWVSLGLGSGFGTFLMEVGVGLIIGGVIGLIIGVPKLGASNNNDGSGLGSNLFSGNGVVIAQGGAVTLVYGRTLVHPMPIAISIDNYDTSVSGGGTDVSGATGFTGDDGRTFYDNDDGSGRGS